MINLTFAALSAFGALTVTDLQVAAVTQAPATPLILSRCPKDDLAGCFSAKTRTLPNIVVPPVVIPDKKVRPRIELKHRW